MDVILATFKTKMFLHKYVSPPPKQSILNHDLQSNAFILSNAALLKMHGATKIFIPTISSAIPLHINSSATETPAIL